MAADGPCVATVEEHPSVVAAVVEVALVRRCGSLEVVGSHHHRVVRHTVAIRGGDDYGVRAGERIYKRCRVEVAGHDLTLGGVHIRAPRVTQLVERTFAEPGFDAHRVTDVYYSVFRQVHLRQVHLADAGLHELDPAVVRQGREESHSDINRVAHIVGQRYRALPGHGVVRHRGVHHRLVIEHVGHRVVIRYINLVVRLVVPHLVLKHQSVACHVDGGAYQPLVGGVVQCRGTHLVERAAGVEAVQTVRLVIVEIPVVGLFSVVVDYGPSTVVLLEDPFHRECRHLGVPDCRSQHQGEQCQRNFFHRLSLFCC